MPARSGRLEKRIRLAVPVEIFSPQNPAAAERTSPSIKSRAAPSVAIPHADSSAKLAIRHAAPMAHVLAAIYLKCAGLDGDLHACLAFPHRLSDEGTRYVIRRSAYQS